MVAVPVMKLFSLTVKTLAKPVAKRIKSEGERHPIIRVVLGRMGQATNSFSARVSIRMAGHKTTKIKPLEEDKAVAAGGNLLAEGFVYSLGASLMIWEYFSSASEKEAKEAVSKAKKRAEQRQLAEALETINNRLTELEAVASRQEAERKALLHRTDAPDSSGGDVDDPHAVPRLPPDTSQWRLPLGLLLPWRWGRSEPTAGEN